MMETQNTTAITKKTFTQEEVQKLVTAAQVAAARPESIAELMSYPDYMLALLQAYVGVVATDQDRRIMEDQIAAAQAAVKSAQAALKEQGDLADTLGLTAEQKLGMIKAHQTTLDTATKELEVAQQALARLLDEEVVRLRVSLLKDKVNITIKESGLSKAKGERGEYTRIAPADKAIWIKPGKYYYRDAAGGAAALVFTLDHVTVTRPGMAEGVRIDRADSLSAILHYTTGSIPAALGHSGDKGSSWSSTVFARGLKLTTALGKGLAGSAYPDGLSGIMYEQDITAAKQAAAKHKAAAK